MHPLWTTWESTTDRLTNFILDCTQKTSTKMDKTHTSANPCCFSCIAIKEKGWKKQALWFPVILKRLAERQTDRVCGKSPGWTGWQKENKSANFSTTIFTRSLLLSFSLLIVFCHIKIHWLIIFPLFLSVFQLTSHLLSATAISVSTFLKFLMSTSLKVNMKPHSQPFM